MTLKLRLKGMGRRVRQSPGSRNGICRRLSGLKEYDMLKGSWKKGSMARLEEIVFELMRQGQRIGEKQN